MTETGVSRLHKLIVYSHMMKPNHQEQNLLIMGKTAQFFHIKIIIYKLRQQFNPSLILGNASYNKRWPPLQIRHTKFNKTSS